MSSTDGRGPVCDGHQDKNHKLKAYYDMKRMDFYKEGKSAGAWYPYKGYDKEAHEEAIKRAKEEAQLEENKKDIVCQNCKKVLRRDEWGYIKDDHVSDEGLPRDTYKYICKWKPEAFQITVYR